MNRARGAVFAAFGVVYVVWGSTYLAIRIAIETLPPFLMAGARFAAAGAALWAFEAARGRAGASSAHWRAAAVSGCLMLLGGNGGVVWAERSVPSGTASLFIATVPLWMVLFDALAARRSPFSARTAAGVACGFAGVWTLLRPVRGVTVDPAGGAVLLGAAVAWAAGSVHWKRAPKPASPLCGVALQMLCGGAALAAAGVSAGEAARFDASAVSARSAWALAYLIVFGSFAGFTAYAYLLERVPVARVSTYAYVNPLVAVALGAAFAGEPVATTTAVAGALILGGVALLQGVPEN